MHAIKMQHHLNQVYGIMKIQNIQLQMDVLLPLLRKTQLSTKSVIFHCQNWCWSRRKRFLPQKLFDKNAYPYEAVVNQTYLYQKPLSRHCILNTRNLTVGWMRFCNPSQPFNICSLHVIWFQTSAHFQSPVVPFHNWLIKVRIKWFSLFQILSLEYICGFFENHQVIGKAGSFTLLWRPEFF